MSVNSKMTAIADAIRAKTGGTGLLTLDDMAQDIAAIDTSEDLDEVLDEQESLIDQIQAALEGKTAGSGTNVETFTLTLYGVVAGYAVTVYDNNTISHRYVTNINTEPIEVSNVVCDSVIMVSSRSALPAYHIIGTAQYLCSFHPCYIFSAPTQSEECSIEMMAPDGGGADD